MKNMNKKENFDEILNLIGAINEKKQSIQNDFPPMKFKLGDMVKFNLDLDGTTKEMTGEVAIADFGGSLKHDMHSYDVMVDDFNGSPCLFKHILEEKLTKVTNEKREQ